MKQLPLRFHPAILLLAFLAAGLTYAWHSYSPLSLVLIQRTATAGIGKVYWDSGNGYNENQHTEFAVAQGEAGAWNRYFIHLPPTKPVALKVVPLAREKADFEILSVAMLADNIRYNWQEQGICTAQQIGRSSIKAENCPDGPTIAFNPDKSVTIGNIPAAAYEISPIQRAAVAAVVLLLTLLGGCWLLAPANGATRFDRGMNRLGRLSWLGLICCYLLQYYLLSRYAFDTPHLDDWSFFEPGGLQEGFSWRWLLAFHNEHRIVLTKLMAWLNLQLFGLDFGRQLLVNFLLFGLLLATVARLKQKLISDRFPLFPLFLLFLLSPLNYKNHVWAFQSQFHLVVIFMLTALAHAFEEKITPRSQLIIAAAIILAAYSFSVGVVFGGLLLTLQAVYVAVRLKTGNLSVKPLHLIIPALLVIVSLAAWFIGYSRPELHPVVTLPLSPEFWSYYLNLLSFGFGFTKTSALPGIVCLVLVLTPLVLIWTKVDPAKIPSACKISAAILTILVLLAVITMGRAGISMPKSSRYAEFGLLLIPLAAVAWYMAIPTTLYRNSLVALFFLFCLLSSLGNWSPTPYREERIHRIFTLECVDRFYKGSGDSYCELGYGEPLDKFINGARSAHAKFTRQFDPPR